AMSLCIIGAGTAGLCSARRALEHNVIPTIFELSNEVGGTWVYTKEVGVVNGIDVHSSMYTNLRTNLPKEIMGFPDFEIENDKDSYVSSQNICSFLKQYSEHHDLGKYIQFNSYVIRVLRKFNKWQILVKNTLTNKLKLYFFDKILIANGHYHTPNYANFPNGHLFKGECLHSHDYRSSEIFKGKEGYVIRTIYLHIFHLHIFVEKSVLVIGGGPSALDLTNQIAKSAKHVTLSHHVNGITNSIFHKNVETKPDIIEFDKNGAYFKDGSYSRVDSVFFCTGYKYAFPFLNTTSGIYVENNHVQMLYKQCINIRNPSMAFIGLPFYVCAAQMMDLQARFALSYLFGSNQLPPVQDMLADTLQYFNKLWEKGYKKRQAHMLGDMQMDYYSDLAMTAKIENIKPVMAKLHIESSNCFNNNLLSFRDDLFKIIDNETFVKIN
ncbi:hypothetical protein KR222_001158, partial [Zaprionus bogoriensis]